MACINPDGSLGQSARVILASLFQPTSPEDVSRNTNLPIHRINPCLQELIKARLIEEKQGSYQITAIGVALLNS